MSVIVVLMSSLMISNSVTFVSTNIISRSWKGLQTSIFGQEIAIEGSEAEEMYLTEQWNQIKAMENLKAKYSKLQEKAEKLKAKNSKPQEKGENLKAEDSKPQETAESGNKYLSKKEQATLNSFNAEFSKLSQELREIEFCSEPVTICDQAFKSSFFSGRKYNLKTGADAKKECVKGKITARKGKQTYNTGYRHMVQCDINYKSGVAKVFLVPSTKYDREKNLRFFVLTEQNEKTIEPIAYLVNKKDKTKIKAEKPNSQPENTIQVKSPASSTNAGDNILESIDKDIEYAWIYPVGVFMEDIKIIDEHAPATAA